MKNHKFQFEFKKSKKAGYYPAVNRTGQEKININLIPGSKLDTNNKEKFFLILRIKGNKEGLLYLAKNLLILALLKDQKGYHINIDNGCGVLENESLEVMIEYTESDNLNRSSEKISKEYKKLTKKMNKISKKLSKDFFKNL